MEINFSYNWNNKLECRAFTTLRIYNPEKHRPGTPVEIKLKEKNYGEGVIKAVKVFTLDKLNPFISYLDTGYSVEECTGIIRRMYKTTNLETARFALILIVKNK